MPAVDHINRIHLYSDQVIRKRHDSWASFTVPLCAQCMEHCAKKLLIRYAVLAAGSEQCKCPCRAQEKAAS
jgi:hypothetical protein